MPYLLSVAWVKEGYPSNVNTRGKTLRLDCGLTAESPAVYRLSLSTVLIKPVMVTLISLYRFVAFYNVFPPYSL
jgi:hypothetical protein